MAPTAARFTCSPLVHLPPEIWEIVLAFLPQRAGSETGDNSNAPVLGPSGVACIGKRLYWQTRPCLWRKISVLPTTSLSYFANVATARINYPYVSFTFRASLIKQLRLCVSDDTDANPCWWYTLMVMCTSLEILEFELTSTTDDPQTVPFPLILGIDVGHPPLRRVAFSGDAYVPSVAQLDVLVGTLTNLEVLEISTCFLGATDRHLYPTTNGPCNVSPKVKSLRLDPGMAMNLTANLVSLPTQWSVDNVEGLWTNECLDLEPWLQRYGGCVHKISCVASQPVFHAPGNRFSDYCTVLESLRIFLGYGAACPAVLPSSLRQITLDSRCAGWSTMPQRCHMVQEYLEEVLMAEVGTLQSVTVDVSKEDLEDWLEDYGEALDEVDWRIYFYTSDERSGADQTP